VAILKKKLNVERSLNESANFERKLLFHKADLYQLLMEAKTQKKEPELITN